MIHSHQNGQNSLPLKNMCPSSLHFAKGLQCHPNIVINLCRFEMPKSIELFRDFSCAYERLYSANTLSSSPVYDTKIIDSVSRTYMILSECAFFDLKRSNEELSS